MAQDHYKGKHRLGAFSIKVSTARKKDKTQLASMLDGILVIDAKPNFATMTIDYMGFADFFDEIEDVSEPPTYYAQWKRVHKKIGVETRNNTPVNGLVIVFKGWTKELSEIV